ncbi:REP element-mobilizing transposase RayT [Bacillus mesophilus]|uniref:Transposase n=1 Tax=Bacillus mesophilus TaxID=1808955 RepID=A0A6M0QCM6_9BACI|nr:transposase [Bacillus mesophilus]MBM7662539.1 REP element-mobilizing transposase RayT [Bacillus mesophilus]NEY72838.1 transposase [Bacillus mesophilus]
MPREARKKSSSGVYHVMLRGINKQTIFEDDQDRKRFLETLKKYKDVSKFNLYSYCLMDNHVHLLLQETEESISEVLKRISSSYVYWYNLKYERSGHLFQERFKSENVDSTASFLKVLRYIHQNPTKAGLADNVFNCKWTSINEYVGRENMIDTKKVLHLFSPDLKIAMELFIQYTSEPNQDECLDDEVRPRLSDHEVRATLKNLGVTNIALLQQMEKEKRDEAIASLKDLKGISLRQLSRVTGISKSVIQRVR